MNATRFIACVEVAEASSEEQEIKSAKCSCSNKIRLVYMYREVLVLFLYVNVLHVCGFLTINLYLPHFEQQCLRCRTQSTLRNLSTLRVDANHTR